MVDDAIARHRSPGASRRSPVHSLCAIAPHRRGGIGSAAKYRKCLRHNGFRDARISAQRCVHGGSHGDDDARRRDRATFGVTASCKNFFRSVGRRAPRGAEMSSIASESVRVIRGDRPVRGGARRPVKGCEAARDGDLRSSGRARRSRSSFGALRCRACA